ncbi:MAG: hypothetical protein WA423_17450, partial [Candidatus Sulfotelmatobacter sp.]
VPAKPALPAAWEPQFAWSSLLSLPLAKLAGLLKLSLIKAIARAHNWHQKVLEAKAYDLRSLARHAGLAERYAAESSRVHSLRRILWKQFWSGGSHPT